MYINVTKKQNTINLANDPYFMGTHLKVS